MIQDIFIMYQFPIYQLLSIIIQITIHIIFIYAIYGFLLIYLIHSYV